MVNSFNFVTWNVKGMNHPVKRKKVLTHLKNLSAGIAFIQETHLKNSDNARLKCGWVGQIFHSTFQGKARGVAILINKHVSFTPSTVKADKNGRYVIVTGKLENLNVALANIYAPNSDDPAFFSHVFSLLPCLNSDLLIMGGDFNLCLDPGMDRSSAGPGYVVSKSASYLQSFLSNYGISDIWRFLHPNDRQYSFFSHPHQRYSRIDYFFTDNKLISEVQSSEYQPIVISDHAPLLLKLNIPNNTARRLWRFNSLLLSDEEFLTFISDQISLFLDINMTSDVSISTVWETLKAYLRGQVISFMAKKKKDSKAKQIELEGQIADLDNKNAQNPSPDLYKERLKLRSEYDMLTSHSIEYLLLKNRSNIYEHGDKAGEILAKQLKGARAKQVINGVTAQDGKTVTDQLEINQVFQHYYKDLYNSNDLHDPSLISNFFKDLPIPVLSSDQVLALDAPIQQQEILAAIKSLQPRKSPGPDGFPSEFYSAFSQQLALIFATVCTDSFNRGSLPDTLNQACITLLPKKDKDPLKCSSYRPVSLLNSDYKILAKVLALRLEQVLPCVISPDQTGFVKDRRSFFGIRRLLNVLYTPSLTDSECLLSMDAEKAFDRVEWGYLFETLQRFGFGNTFISWVKLLYACPSAMVLTNNHYSELFRLHRGTRQGCPLSPLLFVLAIEPLAIAIRNNPSIHGIERCGMEHKVSLYADDLLLFVSEAESTITHILKLLAEFGKISGYKLNLHKSELIPLNLSNTNLQNIQVPFKISEHSFTYLGVNVTRNFCDLFKNNFNELQLKVQQDLSRWSLLPISLAGKVNVIKMSVLPRYLYLFQSLPVFIPGAYFKKLDSAISSFLWNGKKPRLRKEHLQKLKQDGGLALPNFRYYYWAANLCCLSFWARYGFSDEGPKWVELEKLSSSSVSLPAIIGASLRLCRNLKLNNPIVHNSVKIYIQFRKHFDLQNMSLSSPITANTFFYPSVQDAAFHAWQRQGLKNFSDLYIGDKFASFEQLSAKYNLPSSSFFRYLQVRHFVSSSIPGFPNKPLNNIIDDMFSFSPTKKKAISTLLGKISNSNSSSIYTIKKAWEQDLQINISEEDWARVLRTIHSSSMCARHSLIQFKVVHRAHLPKSKLAKIYTHIDPMCDRCKSAEATLIHMFWLCPQIQQYWEDICEALSDMLGVTITLNPLLMLFGITAEGLRLPAGGQKLIAFSTLLARRLILLRWKDAVPPTKPHWIKDVLYHLKLEKIRCIMNGSERKFHQVWGRFLTFFNRPSTKVQE